MLPAIWGEFYPVPVDGVNYFRNLKLFDIDTGVRDKQELVDFFEAQMRTVGQKRKIGYFIFAANLSNNSNGSFLDPLKQPALVNAIANWWGGDTAYFEPCLTPEPPQGLLLQEDFEPSSCPLEKQDSLVSNGLWQVVEDPDDSGNHVLRGSGDPIDAPGALIPVIGRSYWEDYTIKLSMRLMPGAEPSGSIGFREGDGSDSYGLHIGFNQLTLIKHLNSLGQHPTLANYSVPGGTQVGRWYQFEITAVGSTLTVKLDGEQVIQVADEDSPLLTGGVRLGVGGGAGAATVDFDDILIEAVGQ
jgi:hypothetical protein